MNSKILHVKNGKFKFILLFIAGCCLSIVSCDYLDVIPDNIATIDNAFSDRAAAEEYLYGCYSFHLPEGQINDNDENSGNPANPALGGGDETWQWTVLIDLDERLSTWSSTKIGRGEQNAVTPILDNWHRLYTGIRECNIFLENIDNVYDLEKYERDRWIGEAKFLKAYYHYTLFKRYGPIPVVDVNKPVSASVEEVKVYREPVDAVVEYIAATLDDALKTLPEPQDVLEGTQAGRADKLAALTLKAELLLFAASDLFNGNTEMASMVDNRGISLFPQEKDPNKWKIAADACKAAIDACHQNGKALYDLVDRYAVTESPVFQLQTILRQTIGDRWNKELIWGDTKYDMNRLMRVTGTQLVLLDPWRLAEVRSEWAPSMKMVEKYYSSRGVPIENDLEWISNGWYADRHKIRPEPSSGDERYLVEGGAQTAYLHYSREPRFYAHIAFDQGVYYGTGWYVFEDGTRNVKYANYRNLGFAGHIAGNSYSITGYGIKKLYSFRATQSYTANSYEYYPFPIFRLADLYLMYAEALNESEGAVPDVFHYINLIRRRAGLEDLEYCWDNYTNLPKGYYNDRDNMREIIRRERTIEMAFEGKRFWDLRRWRNISEFNVTPQGWNIYGETAEDFYVLTNLPKTTLQFSIKDYFWPIKESDLYVNENLIQNYGW
jgi:hypothetical protein